MEMTKKPLQTRLLRRLLPYIGRYAWLGIGALLVPGHRGRGERAAARTW